MTFLNYAAMGNQRALIHCRLPATRKEEWRQNLYADVFHNAPNHEELQTLPKQQIQELKTGRLTYHSCLRELPTETTEELHFFLNEMVKHNKSATPHDRQSIIVSGPARTGKTTSLLAYAKQIEKEHLKQTPELFDPQQPGPEFIPVVYVTLSASATPLTAARRITEFLGTSRDQDADVETLLGGIESVLHICGTELLIVDDLHFIYGQHTAEQNPTSFLNTLAERSSATVVYAGVNIEEKLNVPDSPTDFLVYQTSRYEKADAQWKALVTGFEKQYRLLNHTPGTLIAEAAYLHQRTRGSLGSLSRLMRTAAIRAIINGEEKVTRTLLESLPKEHGPAEAGAVVRMPDEDDQ